MVENTYTDEEFAALKVIAEAHGGGLTREMLDEYGTKLTPEAFSAMFVTSGEEFDPFENVDEDATPSRGGRGQFEEASGWLKLSMRIKGALSRDEKPFGIPSDMVSKEQWEAAIGGKIGDNPIRYIAGVSAEQSAHPLSTQALIKRQKQSQKTADAEITTEQLNTLINQKIMDLHVAFRPLVRFLYAVNDLRGEHVKNVFGADNGISMLLKSNPHRSGRQIIELAANLLLPKNDEEKANQNHLGVRISRVVYTPLGG